MRYTLWVGVGLALVVSCGARSALLDPDSTRPDGGGGTPVVDAASGGSAGSGGGVSGSGGSPMDAATDAPIAQACELVPAGDPVEIIQFPDRHATAPSLLVLTPGAAHATPVIALQTFASGGNSPLHSDIEAARVEIGPSWPSDTKVNSGPTLVGIEAHGWGELSPSAVGNGVALGWHGDPNGDSQVMIRELDVDEWVPGAVVKVDDNGEAVLDLARGAGLGEGGFGYGGSGYGIVFRGVDYQKPKTPSAPAVAVLGADGNVVIGPHRVAPASDYPGTASSIVWSGASYLLGSGFGQCPAAHDLCAPHALVIAKVAPASGDLVDDSHVEKVSVIPAGLPNATVRRPEFTVYGGRVYVVWRESAAKDPPAFDVVRAAELGPGGEVVSGPVDVVSVNSAISRVTSSAGEFGLVLTWAEDGDPALAPNALGRSHIVVSLLGFDLSPHGVGVKIPSTLFHDYGPPHGGVIASPRGVVVTWSARAQQGIGYDYTYLARLDCKQAAADAGSEIEYGAQYGPPSALERFVVTKYDKTRALCFRVHLVSPTSSTKYSISLPDPWAIEDVTVTHNAASCAGFGGPSAVPATSASGKLAWPNPAPKWTPCTVDADLLLHFPGLPPEPFVATGLELDAWGCDGG